MADIAKNARRGRTAAAISPIALEAVKRIDALFDIERAINGLAASERLAVRQEKSVPLLADLETWLREQRSKLSRSSSVANSRPLPRAHATIQRYSAYAYFTSLMTSFLTR